MYLENQYLDHNYYINEFHIIHFILNYFKIFNISKTIWLIFLIAYFCRVYYA